METPQITLSNLWRENRDYRKDVSIKEKQDRDNSLLALRAQLAEIKDKLYPQMSFNFDKQGD